MHNDPIPESEELEDVNIQHSEEESSDTEHVEEKGKSKANEHRRKTKAKKGISKKKEKAIAREQSKREAARKMFNDFYCKQFGTERWGNLLPALEKVTRYCCMINKYADAKFVETSLESVRNKLIQLPFSTIPCYIHDSDEDLEVPFPQPTLDESNVMNYYLLDAASVLVTEALELDPTDSVLDICAAPGGKSLAILQRLSLKNGGRLVCNELSPDRRKRLKSVIHGYIPRDLQEAITITPHDGTKWHIFESARYDKILVDAPCSSERHLLHDQEELNKWAPSRTKTNAERQFNLLMSAVKVVVPGGLVVYATCSLSENENDYIVEKVTRKSKLNLKIDNSKEWPIGEKTKCGWIVLPDKGDRWGPLYFAVIRRLDQDDENDEEENDKIK